MPSAEEINRLRHEYALRKQAAETYTATHTNRVSEDPVTVCPECNSHNLFFDFERGETVCKSCGLVIEDTYFDNGPQYWYKSETKRHNGAPLTLVIHDKGLTTFISADNKDTLGHTISPKNQALLQRLRRWHTQTRVYQPKDRNLMFALGEINRMVSALGVPKDVQEASASIYRDALAKNLIMGWTIEGVATAAVYAACRRCGIPRTLDEVAEVSRVSKTVIGKTYRVISRKLGLKIPPINPCDYIPRFCTKLGLTAKTEYYAADILHRIEDCVELSGKSPVAIAATVVYLAAIYADEKVSQNDVADVTKISGVTIRTLHPIIVQLLG